MSLNDLGDGPLDDAPILTEATKEYLDYLASLLEDEQYLYAAETMEGIAGTIRATGRVTPGQRQAVRNIIAGAEEANRRPRREGGWKRRYEGYEK